MRGGEPVLVEVLETHHGPVIAGDPRTGAAIALRSVQFAETDRSFDCMLPMMRAQRVDALFAATRGWGLIDHNLVAADTEGHIGHLVRAQIPVRDRANGWLPVPGWTGAHEWDGIVPWEEMPRCDDPQGGAIVTANNRVVSGGAHYLCTDCLPSHRARRVWDRLAALDRATVDDMQAIHTDRLSLAAATFQARLRALDLADPALAAARDHLVAWDGHMDAASTEPTRYVAFRRALSRLVAERSGLAHSAAQPSARVTPGLVAANQLWWSIPELLRADDSGLLRGASWDELLRAALAESAALPARDWASVHTPRLVHPLSAAFPEAASRLDLACAPLGGDNDTVFATGYASAAGPAAVYASLSRYVYDVGAWDNSRWIVTHGTSGHPSSKWYGNQNAIWARGEMVPMLYGWERIEAEASLRQDLLPE